MAGVYVMRWIYFLDHKWSCRVYYCFL